MYFCSLYAHKLWFMAVVAHILPAQILLSPFLSFNLSYPEFSFLLPHPRVTISPLSKAVLVPESSLKFVDLKPVFSLSDILNTFPFFCFLACQLHLPRPPAFSLQIFVLFGFLNNCCVLSNQLHSAMDIVSSYYHLLYCSYLLSF